MTIAEELVKEAKEQDILLYSQPCYNLVYDLTEHIGIDGVQAVLNDIAASIADRGLVIKPLEAKFTRSEGEQVAEPGSPSLEPKPECRDCVHWDISNEDPEWGYCRMWECDQQYTDSCKWGKNT